MVTITGGTGKDAGEEIAEALEERKKKATRDVIHYWFEQSQAWLEEAASQRAGIDSEGRSGRKDNGLFSIQQHAIAPAWTGDEWRFSYPHEGAVFQEFGARSHEIRAKKSEVLAFEWPDAPSEVKEQFEHTEGDLVFFESINHPGIPAIGFTRKGRDKTIQALEDKDVEVEKFGAKGDGQ